MDEEYLSDDMSDIEVVNRDFGEILTAIHKQRALDADAYGWDAGSDKTAYAQNIIERFRLKKLKSHNSGEYYFDNVYYFIWKYEKNSETAEESLVRPPDDACKRLRTLNEMTPIQQPFLEQPDEFW
jgi:hypothetical protein